MPMFKIAFVTAALLAMIMFGPRVQAAEPSVLPSYVSIPYGWNLGQATCRQPNAQHTGCQEGGWEISWPRWLKRVNPTARLVGLDYNNHSGAVIVTYLFDQGGKDD